MIDLSRKEYDSILDSLLTANSFMDYVKENNTELFNEANGHVFPNNISTYQLVNDTIKNLQINLVLRSL
jgi:predicted flavoprotein YhiN